MDPHVPPRREGDRWRCRITPQQRWEAVRESIRPAEPLPFEEVEGSLDEEGAGQFTVNQTAQVHFVEHVFPGGPSDTAEISDKWIYVIEDCRYIWEIHAAAPDEWYALRNPDPRTPNDERDMPEEPGSPWIELAPGSDAHRITYHFFLAPVRLTPDAMQYLLDHSAEDPWVTETVTGEPQTIALADPFRWAVDAHLLYFSLNLNDWQRWINNSTRQAELFIASTLKALIESAPELDIRDDLRSGEPDNYIERYETDELRLRSQAERAAAYVVNCVDAPEHYAVECAAMDQGGQALSYAYQTWSCIMIRLTDVQPGRDFARRILSGDEGEPVRLPRRYLFAQNVPANQLGFEHFRNAWQAAVGVFIEFMPALVKLERTGRFPALTVILDRLGVNTRVEEVAPPARTVPEGRYLSDGARRRRIRRLAAEGQVFGRSAAEQRRFEPSLARDRLHPNYRTALQNCTFTVQGILEVVNLCLAIHQYTEVQPGERRQRRDSLITAVLGVTAYGSSQLERLYEEGRVAGRAFSGIAGFANFASGMIEMLTQEEAAVSAGAGRHDYGAAAGHGIAAAGAAATALGGGMVFAAAIMGGTIGSVLGPLGTIVGIVGAIAILGGSILATMLRANQYELFARHCFVRANPSISSIHEPWLLHGIPTSNRLQEARSLIGLLSTFQVEGQWPIGPPSATIVPGYVSESSVFEAVVLRGTRQAGGLIRYWFYLDQDQVAMDVLSWPDRRRITNHAWIRGSYGGGDHEPRIERDRDGNISEIYVPGGVEGMPHAGDRDCAVWVRLRVQEDSSDWIPRDMTRWVRVSPLQGDRFSSLQTDHWDQAPVS